MNKMYFVMRLKGLGHEMYYLTTNRGRKWTFKIAEALWWKTDDKPKLITAAENSSEVSVVTITKAEYFKRVLQGK